jgi:hypothetical protein
MMDSHHDMLDGQEISPLMLEPPEPHESSPGPNLLFSRRQILKLVHPADAYFL